MVSTSEQSLSCLFPGATGAANGIQNRPLSLRVDLEHVELVQQLLAESNGNALLAATVQTAWACLVRTYTGLPRVCFGVQEIGRKNMDAVDADTDPVMVLEIGNETSFEGLLQYIHDGSASTSSSKDLQYNTSVIFRFGTATATQSSKAATMAESVRKFIAESYFELR
jgi:hypothetical protein